MPCDAACMKIILNTGLMAALGPRLKQAHQSAAAFDLAAAAETLSGMHAAVGLVPSLSYFPVTGCEQAKMIVGWIKDPSSFNSEKAKQWTADIWFAIADLAAGKLPA